MKAFSIPATTLQVTIAWSLNEHAFWEMLMTASDGEKIFAVINPERAPIYRTVLHLGEPVHIQCDSLDECKKWVEGRAAVVLMTMDMQPTCEEA